MTSEISATGITNVPVGPFTMPEETEIKRKVLEKVIYQFPLLFVENKLTPTVFRKVFQYPWNEEWNNHLLTVEEGRKIMKNGWQLVSGETADAETCSLISSKPFQLALELSKDKGLTKLYPSYDYLYTRVSKVGTHYASNLLPPNSSTGSGPLITHRPVNGFLPDAVERVVDYLVGRGFHAGDTRRLLESFSDVYVHNDTIRPQDVDLCVNVDTESSGSVYVQIPITHYEDTEARITLQQLLDRIWESASNPSERSIVGYVTDAITEDFEANAVDNRTIDYDWETVIDNVYNGEASDSEFDAGDCIVNWWSSSESDSNTDRNELLDNLTSFVLSGPEIEEEDNQQNARTDGW